MEHATETSAQIIARATGRVAEAQLKIPADSGPHQDALTRAMEFLGRLTTALHIAADETQQPGVRDDARHDAAEFEEASRTWAHVAMVRAGYPGETMPPAPAGLDWA